MSSFLGCRVETFYPKKPYSNIKQNKVLNALYKKHAMSLGVRFLDSTEQTGPIQVFAGSTDMGNVSYVTPSIHPIYKVGDVANHTVEFTGVAGQPSAQKPTLDASKAMMMMSVELITNSELLQSVKDEFAKDD